MYGSPAPAKPFVIDITGYTYFSGGATTTVVTGAANVNGIWVEHLNLYTSGAATYFSMDLAGSEPILHCRSGGGSVSKFFIPAGKPFYYSHGGAGCGGYAWYKVL